MDLTKQERRLAEISAKTYRRFLYRKSQLIGWLGLLLFLLGLLPFFSWPNWCDTLFLTIGCVMLVWGAFGLAMTVIGKLYEKVQKLELLLGDNDTES